MSFLRVSSRSARTRARSGCPRAHRALSVERLECRRLLDATPLRGEALVDDLTLGDQTIRDAVAAVARTPVNTIIAFSGHGPGDRDGVFAKRYTGENSPIGTPVLVNSSINGFQGDASVAGDEDGNFVVVWAGEGAGDERGIFLQRFNAAGERIGGETLVNTTAGGNQRRPAVAMAADGRFVVAWSGVGAGDFSGVFIRRFDANGVAQGNEILVNAHVDNQQDYAAVAIDDDGQFTVAWSSRHQDGSDWGVYAQRFAADGTRNGAEIAMNGTTADSQVKPSITYLPNGSAVVAWSSRNQDGSGWGVFARSISTTGVLGTETRLSTTTAGHQREVAIAATPQNEVFAVWQTGSANGFGWEVRARVVILTSTSANAELVVNAATAGANSGQQWFPNLATNAAGDAVVVWMGNGALDHDGVHVRRYTTGSPATNVAPNLAPIANQEAALDEELVVNVTATDANSADVLTYSLDFAISPDNATITKNSNNSATIRWTPALGDLPGPATFRVIVSDGGNNPLFDSEQFTVEIDPRPSAAAALARDEDDGDSLAAVDAAYASLDA